MNTTALFINKEKKMDRRKRKDLEGKGKI